MTETTGRQRSFRRPLWVDVIILLLAGVVFVTMLGLGTWQVRRLAWKLDLIEMVETRAYGAPVAAPNTAGAQEYLRVQITGSFQHDKSLTIKAVTELGPGSWVMTPLTSEQLTVWINRGFVPAGLPQDDWIAPTDPVSVTGLIRLDQPGGTLLEHNEPAMDRWVSADLALMSDHMKINTAPYFIAAEHDASPDSWPRGSLTQLEFRNTHLSYALTWYAMALLFLAAMGFVIWDRWRTNRRLHTDAPA